MRKEKKEKLKSTRDFNIVLLDDKRKELDLIKDVVEQMGHSYVIMTNVTDAKKYIKDNTVHLIMTDYKMDGNSDKLNADSLVAFCKKIKYPGQIMYYTKEEKQDISNYKELIKMGIYIIFKGRKRGDQIKDAICDSFGSWLLKTTGSFKHAV